MPGRERTAHIDSDTRRFRENEAQNIRSLQAAFDFESTAMGGLPLFLDTGTTEAAQNMGIV
jgi:hypothetical protein